MYASLTPTPISSSYPKLHSHISHTTSPTAISGRRRRLRLRRHCSLPATHNHRIQTPSLRAPAPTQRRYELLLAGARSLADVRAVGRSLVEDGFDQDPFLATKLINAYSHFGSLDDAVRVFDETRDRTVFVWNALVRAFALAGRGDDAIRLCKEMGSSGGGDGGYGGDGGVGMDRFTYPHLLKACCVADGSKDSIFKLGREVHCHALRRGFEANVHVSTTLVDLYARVGCVWYARCVFDQMPCRNVVSWSALIACYAKNGMPFEAIEQLRMMVELGGDVPNSVTMVNVLQACGALGAFELGRAAHGYVARRGLDSILSVSNALVSMYAKCGSLMMGRRVFDEMVERDVVSWNSMVSGFGVNGLALEAVRSFEEMVTVGVLPNHITFVSVLGACSHMGFVEEGKRIFGSMKEVYNVVPADEHYACMVDLLGRAGRFDEVEKIIGMMQAVPGPMVWGSLLGVCRIHGNVELAEMASSHLFELEPSNAGNYVLLADVYARANMWDDVNRIRKLSETKELVKVAGCSWIEVGRRLYSFLSVDELNPQIEQLHALLVKILVEMKDRGYLPNTKVVLYDLDEDEKERILLGHSEKLAVAFGLINTSKGETIRITKNLRLCEDCHSVTKFISKFANREIFVRDVNRVHHFKDGVCSCGDYW